MKKQFKLSSLIFAGLFLVCSFTLVDFNKSLVGKWELQTIQLNGKSAMSSKEILGESFMKFNSDYTYEESGESTSTGIWKITEQKYLQTREGDQATFSPKMELKELSPDKIQITSVDKTSLVYSRVK